MFCEGSKDERPARSGLTAGEDYNASLETAAKPAS